MANRSVGLESKRASPSAAKLQKKIDSAISQSKPSCLHLMLKYQHAYCAVLYAELEDKFDQPCVDLWDLTLENWKYAVLILETNKSVETLNLTNAFSAPLFREKENQIAIFKNLANLLQKNWHIKNLILDTTYISNDAANILAQALKNSQLQNVSLATCEFESVNGVNKLIAAFDKRPQFQSMDLRCAVTFDQYDQHQDLFVLQKFYRGLSDKLKFDDFMLDFLKQDLVSPEQKKSASDEKEDSDKKEDDSKKKENTSDQTRASADKQSFFSSKTPVNHFDLTQPQKWVFSGIKRYKSITGF